MAQARKKKAVKKTTSSKTVARKTTAKCKVATTSKRSASAKKTVAHKVVSTPIAAKQTKAQIISDIAEATNLEKKQVKSVFEALKNQISRHVKSRGCGEMVIPEVGVKVRRVLKKARKARKGINPFTGEEIMIKAKPASKSVRAVALKALKDLAES